MNRQYFCPLVIFALFVVHANFARTQDTATTKPILDQRFLIPETDDTLLGEGPMRRTDWFRGLWQQRRNEFANRAEQDHGSVVFFGDSITQGWDDRLSKAFPDLKVANRGISGDTTRGMLNRLDEDVLTLEPSAVVMLMGTNDLGEKAAPDNVAGNVKLILDQIIQRNQKTPILLCLVMPSSESKDRPAASIRKLNQLYMELAKGYPQVLVLDTYALFADANGDAKESEFPDLLHPNDLGYEKWIAALRPALATLDFVETEDDVFVAEEGFELLFNGKDLTGWGYRPTSLAMIKNIENWKKRDPSAPNLPVVSEPVWFDGAVASHDGRYVAKHGRLIVTAPTQGRLIQQLWTQREFDKDFELRLEFRALPMADSGVFIREPQLQCRDFVTAGPYTKLTQYKPQQWNELVVVVKDNVAHCTCNGEVLEVSLKVPASGPIGLEGDRGQIEYRRIRMKTLK
jgi:lysophospholipase L1-like esterase